MGITVCKEIADFCYKYSMNPKNELNYIANFRNKYSNELGLYEKIEKECFGDKAQDDLDALCDWTDSFRTIKGKIEEECKALGIVVPETVKTFLSEFQAIAEYEGSKLIIKTPNSMKYDKNGHFKYGKIDPCDDIPAFLGLSEVCNRALSLYPTLKALNHDVGFLYRPGQKLLWAAAQLKTRKNSVSNEKQIAYLTKLVNKLMAGQELISLAKKGDRFVTLEGEVKRMKKKQVQLSEQYLTLQGQTANIKNAGPDGANVQPRAYPASLGTRGRQARRGTDTNRALQHSPNIRPKPRAIRRSQTALLQAEPRTLSPNRHPRQRAPGPQSARNA